MKELRRVMQEVETKAQGPGDERRRRKAQPAGDDGASQVPHQVHMDWPLGSLQQ